MMRSQLARGTITTCRMSTFTGAGRSCISKGTATTRVASGHCAVIGSTTMPSTAGQPSVRIAISAALLFVLQVEKSFQFDKSNRQGESDVVDLIGYRPLALALKVKIHGAVIAPLTRSDADAVGAQQQNSCTEAPAIRSVPGRGHEPCAELVIALRDHQAQGFLPKRLFHLTPPARRRR
ncbi:protein of unknown function [Stenotrophomonas maltophilia]|nr:protein of unknown function [Stenotrophomonas maltophilia]